MNRNPNKQNRQIAKLRKVESKYFPDLGDTDSELEQYRNGKNMSDASYGDRDDGESEPLKAHKLCQMSTKLKKSLKRDAKKSEQCSEDSDDDWKITQEDNTISDEGDEVVQDEKDRKIVKENRKKKENPKLKKSEKVWEVWADADFSCHVPRALKCK